MYTCVSGIVIKKIRSLCTRQCHEWFGNIFFIFYCTTDSDTVRLTCTVAYYEYIYTTIKECVWCSKMLWYRIHYTGIMLVLLLFFFKQCTAYIYYIYNANVFHKKVCITCHKGQSFWDPCKCANLRSDWPPTPCVPSNWLCWDRHWDR